MLWFLLYVAFIPCVFSYETHYALNAGKMEKIETLNFLSDWMATMLASVILTRKYIINNNNRIHWEAVFYLFFAKKDM